MLDRPQFRLWQHRSGVWFLLYGHRQKKRISTGHKDKALAERVLAEMEKKFKSGFTGDVTMARGHTRRVADQLGQVYFIYAPELNRLKIGWATSPGYRLEQIRVLSPAKITLLGTIPGTKEIERSLHERYAHCRLHGEWFFVSGTMMSEIENIITDHKQ